MRTKSLPTLLSKSHGNKFDRIHNPKQGTAWVLRVIRDLDRVPANYLKKLVNTDDIWEIRVDVGRNTYRLLGFFHGEELIVLTNSFQKKSQKTPQGEIRLAEKRKADYLNRR